MYPKTCTLCAYVQYVVFTYQIYILYKPEITSNPNVSTHRRVRCILKALLLLLCVWNNVMILKNNKCLHKYSQFTHTEVLL